MNIRPDWNEISDAMDKGLSEEALQHAWYGECKAWLDTVAKHFGGHYRIDETENFLILSDETERYRSLFSAFLERMRKRILSNLQGIASDKGYGKHAVILFKDIDQYYEYASQFYPEEGEFGLSSGVYINDGYGHFAFPSQDMSFAEPIAAHELTHACLAHLPLPVWLNEGMAVVMEEVLAGVSPFLNNDLILRHRSYWDSQTIQYFWSGEGFHGTDEGQELSYSLAQILVRNISKDYEPFKAFCLEASDDDSGESAALTHLGVSLQDLIEVLLGHGHWLPSASLANSRTPRL